MLMDRVYRGVECGRGTCAADGTEDGFVVGVVDILRLHGSGEVRGGIRAIAVQRPMMSQIHDMLIKVELIAFVHGLWG